MIGCLCTYTVIMLTISGLWCASGMLRFVGACCQVTHLEFTRREAVRPVTLCDDNSVYSIDERRGFFVMDVAAYFTPLRVTMLYAQETIVRTR